MKDFTAIPNGAMDGLSSSEQAVLYWLYFHRNRRTKKCCPSIRLLAKKANLNKDTVMLAVRSLEQKARIGRKCTGIGYTTYYTMLSVRNQGTGCTEIGY